MAGTTLVQLRVPDDLLSRIDEACGDATRTGWLLGLAARELDSEAPSAPSTGARSIGLGIPAPGVLCLWAACMSRDSDRFAVLDPGELTRSYREQPRDEDKAGIALCKHHAAQLEGRVHRAPQRELPPGWRKRQAEPA